MNNESKETLSWAGKLMRCLLIFALAGLAGVEYFHHLYDSHTHNDPNCTTPQARLDDARDRLRQHLYRH